MQNTTDAELRKAWTAAVAHRGRTHPVVERVAEMAQEWRTMTDRARERHRLVALRLLQEIGP